MSSQELKQEINKVIDEIPEPVLGDILEYLKQLKSMSKDKINEANHLKTILREDKELLARLAQ